MDSLAFWIENLGKYRMLDHLKGSSFFARYGTEIEDYLKTPQIFRLNQVIPRLRSFLRVVQWNIEKGKRFEQVRTLLQTDPILQWADVVVLNEADSGMSRSGNRHVAKDLAESLGMHMVYGPAHFELTRGTADDLEVEGENTESLQGNAVLSRYPVSAACLIRLPVSFEPYEFNEKRFGSRSCLWVRLEVDGSPLWIGAVHLELRNTPRCRARQIGHILQNLPCEGKDACLLAGDFNTNSFARGTSWRTFNSVFRLLCGSPASMKERLLRPDSGSEPLFDLLSKSGFQWESLNSSEETARAAINSLEEGALLPGPLLNLVNRRLEPYHGYLCFKLDWLVGRKVRALSRGQIQDIETPEASRNPGTVRIENSGAGRISDHLPIYADIDLA
jgi:endonuclease/exonuclease/phosphatase family metal-dependent hydrolase